MTAAEPLMLRNDPKDKGTYILVRALIRRMGDVPVVIPKAEWTAAMLFGTGMKIDMDEESGDIRVWVEDAPEQEEVES